MIAADPSKPAKLAPSAFGLPAKWQKWPNQPKSPGLGIFPKGPANAAADHFANCLFAKSLLLLSRHACQRREIPAGGVHP
jgi:hypothetical protein